MYKEMWGDLKLIIDNRIHRIRYNFNDSNSAASLGELNSIVLSIGLLEEKYLEDRDKKWSKIDFPHPPIKEPQEKN